MRIHLDLRHLPSITQDTLHSSCHVERMKKQYDRKYDIIKRGFRTGDKVYASNYVANNRFVWNKIVERRGNVM